MKAGEKVFWHDLYAVILSIAGETAHIRIIGKKGQGNNYDVHFKELKPVKKTTPEKIDTEKHYLDCPECGLSFPNYRQGIECPSCSFKEHTRFKMQKFTEWLENYDPQNKPGSGNRMPVIDDKDYPPLKGLEGPFRFPKSGKILYYDPIQGLYYDRKTDLYIDSEEMLEHSL